MNKKNKKNYEKEYYEKNKAKLKIYKKEYYLKNKDYIREKGKAYYLKNREKCLENKKQYRLKNGEKCLETSKNCWKKNKQFYSRKNKQRSKDWYNKNKARHLSYDNKYKKLRRKNDEDFRLRDNLRRRLRMALKTYGNGKNVPANKYGINYKKIIEYLKPFPKHVQDYHVDHIKPLCTFDLTNPKQIQKAFAPQNHQWLLAEENLKKGSK